MVAWYCDICRRDKSTQKKRIPDLLKAYESYRFQNPEQVLFRNQNELTVEDHEVAAIVDEQVIKNDNTEGPSQINKNRNHTSERQESVEAMPSWVKELCLRMNENTAEIIKKEKKSIEHVMKLRFEIVEDKLGKVTADHQQKLDKVNNQVNELHKKIVNIADEQKDS